MFRWLAVCVILAVGSFALVAVLANSTGRLVGQPAQNPPAGNEPDEGAPEAVGTINVSDAKLPKLLKLASGGAPAALTKPVVIPNGTLVMVQQQEVPSEHEGKLIFIGTEVAPGEKVPPEKLIRPNGTDPWFYFLAVACDPDDPESFSLRDRPLLKYKRWKPGDEAPEVNKVEVVKFQKRIRRLEVGETVKAGQLVGLINPAVAYAELNIQMAELEAANSEHLAAIKLRDSALERLTAYRSVQHGAISKDDMLKAQSEYDKAAYDVVEKRSSIAGSRAKLVKAATVLQMHEVHSAIPGDIKHIYKNYEGDAVKQHDPIIEVQNRKLLRVEAMLDVQEALKLERDMEAVVEATRPDPPRTVLAGHIQPITCVTVSRGPHMTIVSGSDDHTMRGWDLASGEQLWIQPMPVAPRSLACTLPSAKRNLLLVGDAAGVGRIFDLDKLDAPPLQLASRHRGAINSVAFSDDGETCATGGEDKSLCLWKTATGELLHRVSPADPQAHRNAITTVQFLPGGRLLTAGRDNIVNVWDIADGKFPAVAGHFEGRGGDVAQLSASPDGQFFLFDQGRELRVRSTSDGRLQAPLTNPSGSLNFSTMALFSPDGKTILTNGAAPGKLQLWRAPAGHPSRASELRQFIWSSGTATCGAFAPDGSAAVTGTQDHQILVWAMPSKEEVERRLTAKLVLVEPALDTRSRQVRVWAELENPGWLIPGATATLVVVPPPSKLRVP